MGKPFCCFCDFLSTLQCLTQAILSYSQALGQTFNKKKWFCWVFSSFFFVGGCSALVSDTDLTCSLARLELVMWPRLSI